MGINRPRKPSGPHPLNIFGAAVWDYLWGGKFPFHDSDTVKIERGESGYSFRAALPGSGGGTVQSTLSLYRFKSFSPSSITCRSWDGSAEGSKDVVIAHPYKLRSLTTETINGVVYNYNYVTKTGGIYTRQVTAPSDDFFLEEQVISPPFLLNDLIVAAPFIKGYLGGPGTQGSATLINMNLDGRVWASVSGASNQFVQL